MKVKRDEKSAEDRMLEDIEKYGKLYRGYNETIKYLRGEVITLKQSVLGKCFDCMGYYADGKCDCKITTCTLYPFMPFNAAGPRKRSTKPMSEERKASLLASLAKSRLARQK
uniref:Uncharacterized protein n=1 Tax=viral metagenome TaxID=1070528 RepID=A0A6H1ZH07_9ZZZZ